MDYLEKRYKHLGGIGVAEELQKFFELNGTSLTDLQKEILTYRWKDSDLVMFSYKKTTDFSVALFFYCLLGLPPSR